jgi:3'(2'), 5'-bisphosphate nucleotidase
LIPSLLSQAVAAAYAAAQAILRLYGDTAAVDYKADRSPLTAADRAAHGLLQAALGQGPDALPVLSEEGSEVPYAERAGWGRFWLIDPLDGTKEFLQRNGEFTVNVALVEDGRAVLGVVLAPVLGTLYVGGPDVGAFRAVAGQHYRSGPELVAGAADPAAAGWEALPRPGAARGSGVRVVVSRSHENDATRAMVARLAAEHGGATPVPMGSSLKLCLVADGSADLYPRLGPTMEWDTAAAQAVVEGAGGSVTEYPAGTPLHYNKPDLHNPFFVARRGGWPAAPRQG